MPQSLHRISKIELVSFRQIRALFGHVHNVAVSIFSSPLVCPLTALLPPYPPPSVSPPPLLVFTSLIAHKIVFIAVIN